MILLVRMAHPNSALSPPDVSGELPRSPEAPWLEQLEDLLQHAAEISAQRGLDPDAFMHAAWEACLQARPGLREQLEDKELRAQLKKLRKRVLVASA